LVPLAQLNSQEFEVDVFTDEQQSSEDHSRGKQDERAREVEYFERQRHIAFVSTALLTHTGQPELLQSFHSSFAPNIVNPLIATLKPHSNRPSYSNTVTGTLAVDEWVVTFCKARRGLGGAAARPVPFSLYQM